MGRLAHPILLEIFKMLDQHAVIEWYQSNTSTVAELATQFGITPSQASAVLHLAGIRPRRGNPNGPPPEAQARALKTRRAKALVRIVGELVDKYGFEAVEAVLQERAPDGQAG